MLIHQVVSTFKRLVTIPRSATRLVHNLPNEKGVAAGEPENPRKLKTWRKPPEKVDSFLQAFNFRDEKDDGIPIGAYKMVEPTKIKYWIAKKKRDYVKWNQRYIADRHEILGNHLATAHFMLFRKGRVRQRDCTEFLAMEDLPTLPVTYDPNFLLEETEFIGSDICYEGMENFKQLRTLKRATFRNCELFDNWCLERLLCNCPNLEYLDISGCKLVDERGLEGVYRTWHLKHLIVTDYSNTAAFELTCMMLEDCLPDLKLEIIKAPKTETKVEGEKQ